MAECKVGDWVWVWDDFNEYYKTHPIAGMLSDIYEDGRYGLYGITDEERFTCCELLTAELPSHLRK